MVLQEIVINIFSKKEKIGSLFFSLFFSVLFVSTTTTTMMTNGVCPWPVNGHTVSLFPSLYKYLYLYIYKFDCTIATFKDNNYNVMGVSRSARKGEPLKKKAVYKLPISLRIVHFPSRKIRA